jgi:hypothetical protein
MGDSRFACCLQGGGVYVGSGTVTITSSSIYANTASYVRAHVQKFPSPDVKVADVLALTLACTARCLQGGGVYVSNSGTVTITSSSIHGNTASVYVRAHVQKIPLSRWEITSRSLFAGDSRFARCLQGGGVQFSSYGGTVSIVNSQIYSNTADYVRADVRNSPSPDVKVADVLALTHACTTANDPLVNYSMYVPQRP